MTREVAIRVARRATRHYFETLQSRLGPGYTMAEVSRIHRHNVRTMMRIARGYWMERPLGEEQA